MTPKDLRNVLQKALAAARHPEIETVKRSLTSNGITVKFDNGSAAYLTVVPERKWGQRP